MAKVKFYRGVAGSSLPLTTEEGAIFVLERDAANGFGDIYVDIANGKRLHIKPENQYIFYDDATMRGLTSEPGCLYIITEDDDQVGIKIGDGNAYIGDLPVYGTVIPPKKQAIWDSKIDAFMEQEINPIDYNEEKLILTRDYYFNGLQATAIN